MEYAYRFRLYPNAGQENLIQRTFCCCRFAYNYFLDRRKQVYDAEQKTLGYAACSKELTALKPTYPWLYEVDSTALQSSLRDLDRAYQTFFSNVKKNVKPYGYPQFKKKHDHRESYTTKNNGTNIRILDDKHMQIPKLGSVKCAISKEVRGRILSAAISQTPSGKYYVSVCCTDVEIPQLPLTGKAVGIDLGIETLATTSEGITYENPKYLRQASKRLKRLQRSMSRKTKDSKNRNKARIKADSLQEKISNRRLDYLHKLTTSLVRDYDVICIEDLNVKQMSKTHQIAKHLSDVSFGEFRRQLEYKADWYGKRIVHIDRYFPSSQLCADCGYQNTEVKNIAIRQWVCPQCGAVHNRDHNAARNILAEGLKQLA